MDEMTDNNAQIKKAVKKAPDKVEIISVTVFFISQHLTVFLSKY